MIKLQNWDTVVPMTKLHPGQPKTRKHYIKVDQTGDQLFTHLRFNIFRDGGIARLRIYGFGLAQVDRNSEAKKQPVQGKCVEFSDAYFGHPNNLLKLEPTTGMKDGWETSRRLDRPAIIDIDDNGFYGGEEWAVLQLDKTIVVSSIEVDTTHFKGNCPNSVRIDGACAAADEDTKTMVWETMLSRRKLDPNRSNGLVTLLKEIKQKPINHVRVVIMPDGGIARIRIYGNEFYTSQ
ncbi:probable allantoicase [Copidosoma floridanum]|uniref:probable allantoicase n=1 Tax=Copidosoma floridanum TaxID=29053 RepID=UPI0006C96384|nr:probable allantoicase [Copidosoma floridanum]